MHKAVAVIAMASVQTQGIAQAIVKAKLAAYPANATAGQEAVAAMLAVSLG